MKKKRIQTVESRLLEGGEKEKKFQTEGSGGKKVKRWRRSARVGPPVG